MSVQLELNAIKKVLVAKNPELLLKVTPQMFGNEELAKLYVLIRKFYLDQGQWLGWDVLTSIVSSKCVTDEKLRYMTSLIDQIRERDISGLSDDLLVEEMTVTGRCRAVLDSIKEIALAAESKNMDEVIALYQKGFGEIFGGNDVGADDADMASLAGKQVSFNFNTVGIKAIDERGGLIEGGLFGIAGESKAGKSVMALQWSVHNYLKNGESVAYFSYEQGKHEIRARILSSLCDIDIGVLTMGELSEEENLKLRIAESNFLCPDVDPEYCLKYSNLNSDEYYPKLLKDFKPRENKFLIFDDPFDWDVLGTKIELLRTTKDIGFQVVDYPTLVPRGIADKNMASWEYNLLQSRKLKHFARKHTSRGLPTRVVVLAQYDSKEDSLRYNKGLVNDLDMLIKLSQSKEDKELNHVTCSHGGIYRNFRSVKGKTGLEDFKLERDFAYSRFIASAF